MNQQWCVRTHLNRFELFFIKTLSGADRYKPRTIKNLIGQQGEKSCVQKLTVWLRDWYKHHGRSDEKIKAKSSNGFNRSEDPALFKAALLSGPPGIG
jgi:replication factor C subunit 1